MRILVKSFLILLTTVVTVCLCSCTPDDTEKTGFTVAPELTETLSPEPSKTLNIVPYYSSAPDTTYAPSTAWPTKSPAPTPTYRPYATPFYTPGPVLEPNVPSDAAGDYHPVGIVRSYGTNQRPGIQLMGGSKDGTFYNHDAFLINGFDIRTSSIYTGKEVNCALARGNEEYTLYSRTGVLEKVRGTKPALRNRNLVTDVNISYKADTVIAISSGENALPRVPVYTEDDFSVDIDGNGTVERLWKACRRSPLDEEEYYKYTTDIYLTIDGKDILLYSDDNWNSNDLPEDYFKDVSNCYAFDVNGDSTMEILIAEYYWAAIYSIQNDQPVVVMSYKLTKMTG